MQALLSTDIHIFADEVQSFGSLNTSIFLSTFYEVTFSRDGINNTPNLYYWSIEHLHKTNKIKYQHQFLVNIWCGSINQPKYPTYPIFYYGSASNRPDLSVTEITES